MILRGQPTEARKLRWSRSLPECGVSVCAYVYICTRSCVHRAKKNCTHPAILCAATAADSEKECVLQLAGCQRRGWHAAPSCFGNSQPGTPPCWQVLPHAGRPSRKQTNMFHRVIIGSAPRPSTSGSLCCEEQPPKRAGAVRSGFSLLESWRDHISKELFPVR